MSATIYENPDGLPRLQCPTCNNSSWIMHECEPGKDSVVDCSVCQFRAAIGIRGTASAGHVLSDGEAALLMAGGEIPEGIAEVTSSKTE